MTISPMLEEELCLLQCAILPPQTTAFDADHNKFITTYRDFKLAARLPLDYPTDNKNISIRITPESKQIHAKCRNVLKHTPSGEYVLLDVCQTFRSSVDKWSKSRDTEEEVQLPQNFFTVTAPIRSLMQSTASSPNASPLHQPTFFDFTETIEAIKAIDEGSGAMSIEKCMHTISFDSGLHFLSDRPSKDDAQPKFVRKARINKSTPIASLDATKTVKNIKPMLGPYPLVEELEFESKRAHLDLLPQSFSIMTWNILCELFDEEQKKDSEKRFPLIIREIERSDADIIALQEITPEMWQKLVDEPSISALYAITKLPSEVALGQVILTKAKISKCEVLRLSVQKHAIMLTLATKTGRPLRIVNIQLISDYAKNAAFRRMSELATIGKYIDDTDDTILLGDFNFGDDDEEEKTVPWGSFIDAWHILRGSEAGVTFDYERNEMAKITCGPVEISRRLDKIKIKGLLVPSDIHIAAKRAGADGLRPSSHYAVKAMIMQEKSFQPFEPGVRLDLQTAVVILPPESLWKSIDELRQGNDPRCPRWMPHIPLLHPFIRISAQQLPTIVHALQCIAKRVPPFRVKLDGFSVISEREESNIYLDAEPLRPFEGVIRRLFAMLTAAYSMCCAPQVAKVPIGTCETRIASSVMADLKAKWSSAVFDVMQIHVISRESQNDPMHVCSSIQLGFFNSVNADGQPMKVQREAPRDAPAEPIDPPALVLENNPSLHSNPKQYAPNDLLEKWLLSKSIVEYAGRWPTHYSQKGAMYHIPEESINELLTVWRDALEAKEKFYIEERRTEQFRLHIDIDFKCTSKNKNANVQVQLNETLLLETILTHAMAFFDLKDPTVCVTASHTRVFDKAHPDVQSKSGFHVYFQNVWVNAKVYMRFLQTLSVVCAEILEIPKQCISGFSWRNILNTFAAHNDRCRLIGSSKRRKGIGRRYSLHGFYTIARSSQKGFVSDVNVENLYSLILRQDLRRAVVNSIEKGLYATMTSSWGSEHVDSVTLDNNKYRDEAFFGEESISVEYTKILDEIKRAKA